jgi:1,2-diacylglycerol 3-beta-galactosyltransferase
MDPLLPAVLLMGGGEGMGPVEETALALGEALYDKRHRKAIGQIVVICGRNQILQSMLQLASAEWKVPAKVIEANLLVILSYFSCQRIIRGTCSRCL